MHRLGADTECRLCSKTVSPGASCLGCDVGVGLLLTFIERLLLRLKLGIKLAKKNEKNTVFFHRAKESRPY